MGSGFELKNHYHSLKYLFEQPHLNVRKSRWIEFLSEFNFEIKYIKGKENRVENALSRRG